MKLPSKSRRNGCSSLHRGSLNHFLSKLNFFFLQWRKKNFRNRQKKTEVIIWHQPKQCTIFGGKSFKITINNGKIIQNHHLLLVSSHPKTGPHFMIPSSKTHLQNTTPGASWMLFLTSIKIPEFTNNGGRCRILRVGS